MVRVVMRSLFWCGLGLVFSLVCIKAALIYGGYDLDSLPPGEEDVPLHLRMAYHICFVIPWVFAVLILGLALRRQLALRWRLSWACVFYACGVLISYPLQVLVYVVPTDLRYYQRIRFDPIEWRLAMRERRNDVAMISRRKMAVDLVRNRQLSWRSRSEVLKLLGPGLEKCPDRVSTGSLCYYIGWRTSPVALYGDEYLIVTFDSNSIVDEVQLFVWWS